MTTMPSQPGHQPPTTHHHLTATDIENELAQRLTQLAHAFITDLHDQGHLTTTRRTGDPGLTRTTDAAEAAGTFDASESSATVPAPAAPPPAETAQPGTPRWERVTDSAHRHELPPERFATALAQLQAQAMHRLEVTHITTGHQHIHIHITPLTPADWDYWLTQINTSPGAPTLRDGQTQSTTGHVNGIPVTLTAHMSAAPPWPNLAAE